MNYSLDKHDNRWDAMGQAHALLTRLPGIGRFLAYEILIDACYEPCILAFGENDWVNAGPGAKLGLSTMLNMEEGRPRGEMAWAGLIVSLKEYQELDRYSARVTLRGPHLTLRNVEHQLCEFSKYQRIRRGLRYKRNYKATAFSADLSPWENLDARYYTAAP